MDEKRMPACPMCPHGISVQEVKQLFPADEAVEQVGRPPSPL